MILEKKDGKRSRYRSQSHNSLSCYEVSIIILCDFGGVVNVVNFWVV